MKLREIYWQLAEHCPSRVTYICHAQIFPVDNFQTPAKNEDNTSGKKCTWIEGHAIEYPLFYFIAWTIWHFYYPELEMIG